MLSGRARQRSAGAAGSDDDDASLAAGYTRAMIYLIRHGETEFNRDDRVQGRLDSPLTTRGVAQAEAAAARLKAIRLGSDEAWTVTSSPLGRARQTAQVVVDALGLGPPTIDERLIEVSYGDLEGLTRAEVDRGWPRFVGVNGIFGQAPGGETYEAARDRVADWLAEARSQAGPLIAVSHAGVIRLARGIWLGLSVEEIRALDKPQDAIFALAEGRIERIETPLTSSAGFRG